MSVKAAAEQLVDALKTVDGVRVYTDPSATIDPPGVVLGPPRLEWSTGCFEPTEATFLVYVVVAFGDRTLERLWDLVPAVSRAIDEKSDAVVTRADPGVFPAGELPAYEVTCEVGL